MKAISIIVSLVVLSANLAFGQFRFNNSRGKYYAPFSALNGNPKTGNLHQVVTYGDSIVVKTKKYQHVVKPLSSVYADTVVFQISTSNRRGKNLGKVATVYVSKLGDSLKTQDPVEIYIKETRRRYLTASFYNTSTLSGTNDWRGLLSSCKPFYVSPADPVGAPNVLLFVPINSGISKATREAMLVSNDVFQGLRFYYTGERFELSTSSVRK